MSTQKTFDKLDALILLNYFKNFNRDFTQPKDDISYGIVNNYINKAYNYFEEEMDFMSDKQTNITLEELFTKIKEKGEAFRHYVNGGTVICNYFIATHAQQMNIKLSNDLDKDSNIIIDEIESVKTYNIESLNLLYLLVKSHSSIGFFSKFSNETLVEIEKLYDEIFVKSNRCWITKVDLKTTSLDDINLYKLNKLIKQNYDVFKSDFGDNILVKFNEAKIEFIKFEFAHLIDLFIENHKHQYIINETNYPTYKISEIPLNTFKSRLLKFAELFDSYDTMINILIECNERLLKDNNERNFIIRLTNFINKNRNIVYHEFEVMSHTTDRFIDISEHKDMDLLDELRLALNVKSDIRYRNIEHTSNHKILSFITAKPNNFLFVIKTTSNKNVFDVTVSYALFGTELMCYNGTELIEDVSLFIDNKVPNIISISKTFIKDLINNHNQQKTLKSLGVSYSSSSL